MCVSSQVSRKEGQEERAQTKEGLIPLTPAVQLCLTLRRTSKKLHEAVSLKSPAGICWSAPLTCIHSS